MTRKEKDILKQVYQNQQVTIYGMSGLVRELQAKNPNYEQVEAYINDLVVCQNILTGLLNKLAGLK